MAETTAAADLVPRSNIYSYPLGDELILYDDLSKQLFRNNPTAAVVWQGCCAGFSIEEIVAVLSLETGIAAGLIADDVKNVISQWRAIGLLPNSQQSSKMEQQCTASPQPLNFMSENESVPRLSSNSPEYRFRILGTCFRLKFQTQKQLRHVIPMIGHLAVHHETKPDINLSVVHADGRYLLLKDEGLVDWCFHTDGIAPMLHGNALVIAYELSQCLLGLHAAAVCRHGKCILLPAPSGSGKSTLTAALTGSGFSYCADDLVLLTRPPVHMHPVPVAIGLKKGSWGLLKSYRPNVGLLPTHLRSDGKQVRYLVPPANRMVPMASQPLPVDHIVFSQFAADVRRAVLTEIGAADALCRLAAAGYEIQSGMTPESIRQLVDWIGRIPCYEMRYNRLEDAVTAIQSLVVS